MSLDTNITTQQGQENLVRAFSEAYDSRKRGGLNRLYGAWDFYQSLSPEQQRQLRNHIPNNGEFCFPRFIESLLDKKLLLMSLPGELAHLCLNIRSHLETLPQDESSRYIEILNKR